MSNGDTTLPNSLHPASEEFLIQFHNAVEKRLDILARAPAAERQLEPDEDYQRVLRSVNVMAEHHGRQMIYRLIKWMPTVQATGSKLLILRHTFLEAAGELITDTCNLTNTERDMLQGFAFEFGTNVEIEFPQPDLADLRQSLVQLAAKVIGSLSRKRFAAIEDFFIGELQRLIVPEDVPTRTRLLTLIQLMHSLHVGLANDEQVTRMTSFLRRANPLSYTAKERKSQVHHALCRMLTSVLRPLINHQMAEGIRSEIQQKWYETIPATREGLHSWTKEHPKHYPDGYALVTVLTCLQGDDAFELKVQELRREIDDRLLAKKEYRQVAIACMKDLLTSKLNRRSERPELQTWVEKLLNRMLELVQKGTISQENLSGVFVELCNLAAGQLPEYVVKKVVVGSLMAADSMERSFRGTQVIMRILRHFLQRRGLTFRARDLARALAAPGTRRQQAASLTPEDEFLQSLGLIPTRGKSASAGGDAFKLESTLGRAVAEAQRQTPTFRMFREKREAERVLCVSLLRDVTRAVPWIIPESWRGDLPGTLCSLRLHPDKDVRSEANEALRRVVVLLPGQRGAVLASLCHTALTLGPEDEARLPELMRDLIELVSYWRGMVAHEGRPSRALLVEFMGGSAYSTLTSAVSVSGSQQISSDRILPKSAKYDVGLLEGFAICCLCRPDVKIREMALDVLRAARDLHRRIVELATDPVEDSGGLGDDDLPPLHHADEEMEPVTYLLDVIEQEGMDVVRQCYWNLGQFSDLERSFLAGPPAHVTFESLARTSVSDPTDAVRWAVALSELIKKASQMCVVAARHAYANCGARLVALMSPDGDSGLEGKGSGYREPSIGMLPETVDGARLSMWRNLAMVCCSSRLPEAQEGSAPRAPGMVGRESSRGLSTPSPRGIGESISPRVVGKSNSGNNVLGIVSSPEPNALPPKSSNSGKSLAPPPFIGGTLQIKRQTSHMIQARYGLLARPLGSNELVSAIGSVVRGGTDNQQEAAALALGFCSTDKLSALVNEIRLLMDEARTVAAGAESGGFLSREGGFLSRNRGKARRAEELRVHAANILRVVSDNASPMDIFEYAPARNCIADFVAEACRLLPNIGSECWNEGMQLAYCSAMIIKQTAAELIRSVPEKMSPRVCRQLFEVMSSYAPAGLGLEGTAHGTASSRKAEIAKLQNNALARIKDSSERSRTESLWRQQDSMVGAAATLAMAALLQSKLPEDDLMHANGPASASGPVRVLSWVDRLLTSPQSGMLESASKDRYGPQPRDVARQALLHHLTSHPMLAEAVLDRCYHPDARIASGYFQVLSEVFAFQPLPIDSPRLLALVMSKLVDTDEAIRDDAVHLYQVISRRSPPTRQDSEELPHPLFNDGGDPTRGPKGSLVSAGGGAGLEGSDPDMEAMVVMGELPESFSGLQERLSRELAYMHQDHCESVLLEMLGRHANVQGPSQFWVLRSLLPWLTKVRLPANYRTSSTAEPLLLLLALVTDRLSHVFPRAVEDLWLHLASRRDNVRPILSFLLTRCAEAAQADPTYLESAYVPGSNASQRPVTPQTYNDQPSASPTRPTSASNNSRLNLLTNETWRGTRLPFPTLGTAKKVALYLARAKKNSEDGSEPGESELNDAAQLAIDILCNEVAALQDIEDIEDAPETPGGIPANAASLFSPAGQNYNRSSSTAVRSVAGANPSVSNPQGVGLGLGASAAPEPERFVRYLGLGARRAPRPTAMAPSQDPSTPPNTLGGPSQGMGAGSPLTYQGNLATAYPSSSTMVTRAHVALFMAAELVLEQGLNRIGRHLPRLLLVGVVLLDSPVDAIFEHSHRLLMNLCYTLCEERFYKARLREQERSMLMDPPPEDEELANADYLSATAGLIAYLKSARARGGWRRLWAYEDLTLSAPVSELPSSLALFSLVDSVAKALGFVPGLVDRWSEECLQWATQGGSRHLAARSLQCYRSLVPSLAEDQEAVSQATLRLMMALLECLRASTSEALGLAGEVVLTLRALLEALDGGKLLLYPLVFWSTLELLKVPQVELYRQGLEILRIFTERVPLGLDNTQNVLISALHGSEAAGRRMAHNSKLLGVDGKSRQSRRTVNALTGTFEEILVPSDERWLEPIQSSHWLCLLLFKGLRSRSCEPLTIELMIKVAEHVASSAAHSLLTAGVSASPSASDSVLFGSSRRQLAGLLAALLPWIGHAETVVALGSANPEAATMLPLLRSAYERLASCCSEAGFVHVAKALGDMRATLLGFADLGDELMDPRMKESMGDGELDARGAVGRFSSSRSWNNEGASTSSPGMAGMGAPGSGIVGAAVNSAGDEAWRDVCQALSRDLTIAEQLFMVRLMVELLQQSRRIEGLGHWLRPTLRILKWLMDSRGSLASLAARPDLGFFTDLGRIAGGSTFIGDDAVQVLSLVMRQPSANRAEPAPATLQVEGITEEGVREIADLDLNDLDVSPLFSLEAVTSAFGDLAPREKRTNILTFLAKQAAAREKLLNPPPVPGQPGVGGVKAGSVSGHHSRSLTPVQINMDGTSPAPVPQAALAGQISMRGMQVASSQPQQPPVYAQLPPPSSSGVAPVQSSGLSATSSNRPHEPSFGGQSSLGVAPLARQPSDSGGGGVPSPSYGRPESSSGSAPSHAMDPDLVRGSSITSKVAASGAGLTSSIQVDPNEVSVDLARQ